MVKRVLADLHHTGLYHSLQLLFENRLGMELYRPIGLDWFGEGFWRVAEPYNNDWQTVNQYLSLHQEGLPNESRYRLNRDALVENGVYRIDGQRAVELQTFKKIKFDYLVPSIPLHYREWHRLRNLYQPTAKVICQVGNQFDFPWEWAQNILSSTKYSQIPSHISHIFYHQEFPLDIFSFAPTRNTKVISSFLHLFHRLKDYQLWLKLPEMMPEYTFKEYGAEGKEPYLESDELLAEAMKNSDLIVHFKEGGDGFGHIVHNVFAIGRPLLTKKEYYKGKMAFDLMVDGATCLFWRDDKPFEWNIDRIKSFNWADLGVNAHNRFNEVVNFEREAGEIAQFLEKAR